MNIHTSPSQPVGGLCPESTVYIFGEWSGAAE